MSLGILALFLAADPLEVWRQEIERTGGQKVTVLRLAPGEAPPERTPHRAILEQFTSSPDFQNQFKAAQALSIHYQGEEGRLSYVLINPEHTAAADEPYVLAHEYGHLWLKALRYPAPVYSAGPSACLSIHAGDAVQHILIRAEMTQRGIAWQESWIRSLEAAHRALRQQRRQSASGRCQTLAQAALWIDVELGLDRGAWSGKNAFLSALEETFPAIHPAARELAGYLRSAGVGNKENHGAALQHVFTRMKQLALTLPN